MSSYNLFSNKILLDLYEKAKVNPDKIILRNSNNRNSISYNQLVRQIDQQAINFIEQGICEKAAGGAQKRSKAEE